jgi:membrane-associated phospholipid phosphatase
MRAIVLALSVGTVAVVCSTAGAQQDSIGSTTAGSVKHAWIVPAAEIAVAAAADPEIREWVLARHSRFLDRLAGTANAFGTAQHLIPAIGLTYGAALLTRDRSLERGTVKTAAAYFATDLVESLLKPAVGRERPHVEGNSHRFHAFTNSGDWHSFPSAHVAHITAIATAISMQTHSSRVSALCNGMIAIVGWDRIYEDQHWSSDVVATIALGSLVSGATVRWIDSHFHEPPP